MPRFTLLLSLFLEFDNATSRMGSSVQQILPAHRMLKLTGFS
jgi:hypothetical protein